MTPPTHQPSAEEQQILAQFADIILPEPIGWWPLSLQLWVFLITITVAVLASVFLWVGKSRKQRYKKVSLHRLSKIHAHLDDLPLNMSYQKINELLKSCMLACGTPHKELAALYGEEWFQYLLSRIPPQQRTRFKSHESKFLHWTEEAYRLGKSDTNHLLELIDFSEKVIKLHTPYREATGA